MNVAIPLEQGRFFNLEGKPNKNGKMVAIPLEQGRFFNKSRTFLYHTDPCRNPFGAGTVFQLYQSMPCVPSVRSQSLWSRDGFSIVPA